MRRYLSLFAALLFTAGLLAGCATDSHTDYTQQSYLDHPYGNRFFENHYDSYHSFYGSHGNYGGYGHMSGHYAG